MEIVFSSSTAMIYDFLRVILENYNNLDFSDVLEEYHIGKDPIIIQAKQKLWDDTLCATPGLALFFKKDKGKHSFIAYVYDKKLPILSTISTMIDDFMAMHEMDLLTNLFMFYDKEKNDIDFYKDLVSDRTSFYDYVLSMESLDDKQRLEFIGLHCNRSYIMDPLYLLLKQMEKKILKVFIDNNEQIRAFERLMKSKVKNNPDEILSLLSHISNSKLPNESTQKIILSYSFLNEILIYTIGETDLTVLLGIHYDNYLKITKHDDTNISNENFLKAFSDPTRLDIIRMLNGREMFVGEITKNCQLAFSTTSYHIDILVNAGVLLRRMENRRVYYRLNVDYLAQKLDLIKRLILSNTF